MAQLNKPRTKIQTHEGGTAKHITHELQLRRSIMACMLWENNFYEDGESIAARISRLVGKVDPTKVASMAVEARNGMKLRHVPLLLAREMARLSTHKHLVGKLLPAIILRPDELTEFLAIYWRDKRQPLSGQVKKGLAGAIWRFNGYQLAKYNRNNKVKLRDILRLCHPKPVGEQAEIWGRLIAGTLQPPDTWEVALSSGKDKLETWSRLLVGHKIGALALLRNLRNMHKVGVDKNLIKGTLAEMNTSRILPFRFITAARHAPRFEHEIEVQMFKSLEGQATLPGHTVLLVDVSGSMENPIAGKTEINRIDATCGIAMLLREICEEIDIFTFSAKLICVPSRHGFALRNAIIDSQEHLNTPLGLAVKCIYANKDQRIKLKPSYVPQFSTGYHGQGLRPDRLIVITDEQSKDTVPDPIGKGYMINVSTDKNGVGYGAWHHIDGWSETIIDYIKEYERACD